MKYSELAAVYEKIDGTTKRLEKTGYLSDFLKKVSREEIEEVVLLLQGRIFPAWDEREIGVAGQLMAKAISMASGSGIQAVEKEWKKTGDLGNVAENLIKKRKQLTLYSSDLTVKRFFPI